MWLSDIVDLVHEPEEPSMGRPSHSLRDLLKSMAIKVYFGQSAGRSWGIIRMVQSASQSRGYIGKVPSRNSIIDYFNKSELIPALRELVSVSALPLRSIEQNFLADSTGFSTSTYSRWLTYRSAHPEGEQDEQEDVGKTREFAKVHLVSGERTKIITSVEVLGWGSSDNEQFVPLFERVVPLFDVKTVIADGAYIGRKNLNAAELWGTVPYIPYSSHHLYPFDHDQSMWAKMLRLSVLHHEEWLSVYRRRALVETAISMLKGIFGTHIRSKNFEAQVVEIYLMVLCHNIRVLVHEMFELGIYPFFAAPPNADLTDFNEAIPDFLYEGYMPDRSWPVDHRQFRFVGPNRGRNEPLTQHVHPLNHMPRSGIAH